MAAKRFLNEPESNQDQPAERRMKPRPSFASVIGEVVMVNSLQNMFTNLEPLLRKVVKEELENSLRRHSRSFSRSPSLRIQALEPSSLRLSFSNRLNLPIFTGSKITDLNNNALQVQLLDGDRLVPIPLKVEIVVIDGDFPGDSETWTSDEFDGKIVKERAGKRPLLTGDLTVSMRDGFAIIGDMELTDNSSWIRSRKFRLGAKVVPGTYQGTARILETMTEAFVVKDHRGELYKKHHPPMLEDEVWRLERIGKDGAFHKKLSGEGIHTVQDFLKLSTVDPSKLKKILGLGMSERTWEATLKHARTCVLGSKHYVFRGNNCALTLNPICQLLRAEIEGQIYNPRELSQFNRGYVENLVREAYANWSSLQELDGGLNETALLTQGETIDEYPTSQLEMVKAYQPNRYFADRNIDVDFALSGGQIEYGVINPSYLPTPIENSIGHFYSSGTSSDGELTPSRRFLQGN